MCQHVADSTVDLLFETIAFFCDCNPFPDPLAPGRIRVRMPQRKDFRKKKKKTGQWVQIPVSPGGSEHPAAWPIKQQINTFLMQKRKTTGIRSVRCRAEDALMFLCSLFCQARGRGERSARERDAKPLCNSRNVPASRHVSWRCGGRCQLCSRAGAEHLSRGRWKDVVSKAGAQSFLAP